MVTVDPRRFLLLLALQPLVLGCAAEEPELEQLDVDGEGKGDAATSSDPSGAMKSFRNITRTHVLEVGAAGVADVIAAAAIVLSETALKALEEKLG